MTPSLRDVLAGALANPVMALSHGSFGTLGYEGSPSTFDLIAIGKAASRMVDGVLWGSAAMLRSGLVVLPDGARAPVAHPRLRVVRASHPLPDARSVEAGEAALALAKEGEGEELRVLVSGGASSLAFVPVGGVTLETARDVMRTLLSSGADVRAINVVRRHLSRMHGGGLVRAAWPRPTRAVISSDVIDGDPWDVGSGPAVPDPTTLDDACVLLSCFAPSFASLPLVESLKATDAEAAHATHVIASQPGDFAATLACDLESAGYATRVLPPSTEDVATLADEYIRLARTMNPGDAILRSAEPSVRLDLDAHSRGAGGRCTHIAALVACDLPPGAEFLAAATDGVDGTSGTAGALVNARSFRRSRSLLDAAIDAFDTGSLHLAHGSALPFGPTGLNFADVHVLVMTRDESTD